MPVWPASVSIHTRTYSRAASWRVEMAVGRSTGTRTATVRISVIFMATPYLRGAHAPTVYPSGRDILQTDDAHVPVDWDLGPEGLRDVLQPLQGFLGHLALRQQRPATLGDGASKAHVDGIELDLFEGVPFVMAHPDDALPEDRIGRKAALPGVRTGLEE